MHRPLGSEEPRHRSRSSPPHHWHSRPLASPRASRTSHRRPPSSTKARGIREPDHRPRRPTDRGNRHHSWNATTVSIPPRRPSAGCGAVVGRMPAIRRCPVPSDPVELTKQIKAASDIVAVVVLRISQSSPPAPSSRPSAPSTTTPAPRSTSTPSASATGAGPATHTATSFAFVMHMEKVGFTEARPYSPRERESSSTNGPARPQDHHQTRLLEVMRWAQAKYQHCLLEDAMRRGRPQVPRRP